MPLNQVVKQLFLSWSISWVNDKYSANIYMSLLHCFYVFFKILFLPNTGPKIFQEKRIVWRNKTSLSQLSSALGTLEARQHQLYMYHARVAQMWFEAIVSLSCDFVYCFIVKSAYLAIAIDNWI